MDSAVSLCLPLPSIARHGERVSPDGAADQRFRFRLCLPLMSSQLTAPHPEPSPPAGSSCIATVYLIDFACYKPATWLELVAGVDGDDAQQHPDAALQALPLLLGVHLRSHPSRHARSPASSCSRARAARRRGGRWWRPLDLFALDKEMSLICHDGC